MLTLLIGFVMVVLCLVLQAIFVTTCLRQYVRIKVTRQDRQSYLQTIVLLSTVLLLMLLANIVQMGLWAVLFRVLGEFDDFATALYFSAVTFATLGYGDVVMSVRWRMLGPLEAANGILMFGVSTAVMTTAVMDVIKQKQAKP